MKKRYLTLFLLLQIVFCYACSGGGNSDTPRAKPGGDTIPAQDKIYKLVWQDEFNVVPNKDGSLPLPSDTAWSFETGNGTSGWGNNELEYYIDKVYGNDTVAKIQNGNLVITAFKIPQAQMGFSYISTRMNTKRSWKYGKIEMRAKLPAGRGLWPAFWMLPLNFSTWPYDGEIDIMEYVGYRPGVVQATVHVGAESNTSGITATRNVGDAESQFHVYSMEWTADNITISVDSIPYFIYNNDKKGDKNTWPFNTYFYVKLNLAVGGNWGGLQGIDDSAFPARYEIDYVRVYQKE